jgi:hypothetical protein
VTAPGPLGSDRPVPGPLISCDDRCRIWLGSFSRAGLSGGRRAHRGTGKMESNGLGGLIKQRGVLGGTETSAWTGSHESETDSESESITMPGPGGPLGRRRSLGRAARAAGRGKPQVEVRCQCATV